MMKSGDIVMKRFCKVFSVFLAMTLIGLSAVAFAACDDDKGEFAARNIDVAPEVYPVWMSYIDDDAPYAELSLPATHNSGAVDCRLFNLDMNGVWLNCQQGTVYDQLLYGVRDFDFSISTASQDGRLFCVHGYGYGLPFDEAVADIRRFSDEHPSEFIVISVKLYADYSVADADAVKEVLDILDPAQYAMDESYNLSEMTMGDIRESGKRFAISCPAEWCDYTTATAGVAGTWQSEYNFGTVDSGKICYDMIWETMLAAEEGAHIRPSLNRATGSSIMKELPLDFMLADRDYFLDLVGKIKSDPNALAACSGFSMDFATYDYVQCGKTLELNVAKGFVKDADGFTKGIEAKYRA